MFKKKKHIKNEYWFISRTKFNEIVHEYIEEKFRERNEARRSFSWVLYDEEKRVVQGKRTKIDETVRVYGEEIFSEVWHSNTKFIWSQRLSYKERREDT